MICNECLCELFVHATILNHCVYKHFESESNKKLEKYLKSCNCELHLSILPSECSNTSSSIKSTNNSV